MGDSPSSRSRAGATVLLVDDRRTNLVALHLALEPSGFRFVLATDGPSAIEQCDAGSIDLVVLDVFMPKMDGVEVAQHLRKNERTRRIPIVFLTGLPAEVKRRFPAWGARDVAIVMKPYDAAQLTSTMQRLLDSAAPSTNQATAG
jgi:CheY-like chemotaxis protein